MLTLFLFLLMLSVLVLIHELGHFLAARKFGVKVEEFGFGIPPRAWGKKIGETLYSINWLPFGGFVKLYGEDESGSGKIGSGEDPTLVSDKKRAFFAKPYWQKVVIVAAGVVMNALLAVVVYYLFLGISNFKTELPLLGNHTFFGVNQTSRTAILIGAVSKDSPAEKAKVTPGSRVVSINGKKVSEPKEFAALIQENKGKPIQFSWQDLQSKRTFTETITPRVNAPKDQGAVGVQFFPIRTVELAYDTPLQKAFSGFIHPTNLMAYNFNVMAQLIRVSFEEKTAAPLSEGVAGPVGIYSVVGTIAEIPEFKERLLQFLNLVGLLSISLAVFNVLPIPALDGGRLFFIIFEWVSGKKVNPKVESTIHAVGMAILLGLIILITFKDIGQFFLK